MRPFACAILLLGAGLLSPALADEVALDVVVTAEPRAVAPGAGSVITASASSAGRPVAGVELRLTSEGGVFGVGAHEASGVTDDAGVFRTVWRSVANGEGGGLGFQAVDYEARREGFPTVTGRLLVQVVAAVSPAPPARRSLFVVARADPAAVEAGTPARVVVTVRDGSAGGSPVAGATVAARARAGRFGGSDGPSIAGETDAEGVVRFDWLAPSPSEVPADGLVPLAVRATREGREPGQALLEVGVLPVVSRPPPEGTTSDAPALQLVLAASADPMRVPAGGRTTLTARVSLPNGDPLAGAEVVVSAGGGSFAGGRGGFVTGTTGPDGTFRAVWVSAEAGAYAGDMGYVLGVRASHPRHGAAEAEVAVQLTAPGAPAATARVLLLEASADPATVAAGGRATVRVRVRTPDRRPLPGAQVEVAAGSGTFEGHDGAVARGPTNAEGVIQVVWRTADPRAYARDVDVVLGVRAVARGFGEARADVPVRVTAQALAPDLLPATPIPIPGPQQPLQVSVTPDRASLAAGSTGWIAVRATGPGGAPVAGAAIDLTASGGTFLATSTARIQGTTDAQGLFRAQWRTDPAATYRTARPHEFVAGAARAGFARANGRGVVTVTPLDIR